MREASTRTPMGSPISRASLPDLVGPDAWFGTVSFEGRADAASLRKTLFDQHPKVGGPLDRRIPRSQD